MKVEGEYKEQQVTEAICFSLHKMVLLHLGSHQQMISIMYFFFFFKNQETNSSA